MRWNVFLCPPKYFLAITQTRDDYSSLPLDTILWFPWRFSPWYDGKQLTQELTNVFHICFMSSSRSIKICQICLHRILYLQTYTTKTFMAMVWVFFFLAAKFLRGVGECRAQLISGTTPVYFTVRRPDIPGQGQDPKLRSEIQRV